MRPLELLPELCLFLGALTTLIAGSFLPRTEQWIARLIAIGALGASAVAAVAGLMEPPHTTYDGTYAIDTATGTARVVIALATVLVICLAADELRGDAHESETYALLLLAAAGAVALAGASDLLVMAVGYLLASVPLYGLVGLARTPNAAEAALKTYLLGALLGIGLLLGITILYGVAGTTTYAGLAERLPAASGGAVAFGVVAIFGGLLFKAGGVPGHFWVPDAAEGGNAAAAAYLTTVPKIGALVALYRLADTLPATFDWRLLVGILAVASMTLGNLAAFAQTDPRRLLAWSTVSQVGYLLVPVAVAGRSDLALPALLLYLCAYAVTNVAAFAVVAAFPERRRLAAYGGLASAQPKLAAALLVSLLGLVGTPPAGVFVGKLMVATAAWDGGSAWLAVAVVVNTVISLFYYLRWLVFAYRDSAPPASALIPQRWAATVAICAATASLAIGVAAGGIWAVIDGSLSR